jgi:hypothetical protein
LEAIFDLHRMSKMNDSLMTSAFIERMTVFADNFSLITQT